MKKAIIIILIFMCGCISAHEMQGLMTLKRYSGNQNQQDKYIKAQEAKFQKLIKYVQDDKLREGRSKKWVLASFGEPALNKEIQDDSLQVEFLMYRHPDQFFGSEKVYLYFDKEEALVSWRYEEGY